MRYFVRFQQLSFLLFYIRQPKMTEKYTIFAIAIAFFIKNYIL